MTFDTDTSRDFEGKAALVVGGSSGIGLGIAALLRRRGARVTVVGVGGVEEALAELGEGVRGLEGDASDEGFVREVVDTVDREDGGVGVLVNSAAVHPLGDVTQTSPAEWDRTMAINLRSMFLSCHFSVPGMVARGSGAIVNVASVQASACSGSVCAYATTKGGIVAFTRTLAVDLGPKNIRANVLSPGSIITPMQEYFADMNAKEGQTREDMYAQFAKPVPLGRLGDMAETAELACFLASDRAGFCNGGEFVADGGLLGGLRLY